MSHDATPDMQHTPAPTCLARLRINGHQLQQALYLAWPDGEPAQGESVVILEQLEAGASQDMETGEGNPAGLFLSFEDPAADEGAVQLMELPPSDEDRPLDNCQVCRGAKGGVLGNENRVFGVVVCDYCNDIETYTPAVLEAAQLMGAVGAPHNELERLAFEAYMRGHCWKAGTWDAKTMSYTDMSTRMLFAVWRDRGALR